ADELPRSLRLALALDPDPDVLRRAALPDPALRLHRPDDAPRVRQVLRRGERAPVRVAPLPLRDGADDRRRALPEDALGHPRHPGAEAAALPRSIAARDRERNPRV